MRLEDLLKPISPDAPCGEDLLAADDAAYVDYYFSVEDRLPTSYFNQVRGTLFDPKSIDLKGETAQIDPLLKRSRDLRMLGVDAKFQILAGRFKAFGDTVLGFAGLLEAFPDEVHPTDPIERQNAIEELNALATVIFPLDYAALITDRRYGDLIYRPYGIGAGKVTAREGEVAGDANAVTGALGSSDNQAAVDTLYKQLCDMQRALKTILTVCKAGKKPFQPKLDRLDGKISDLLEMVVQARPDLVAPEEVAVEGAEGADPDAPPGTVNAAGMTITIAATPAEVPNHRAAYRLLRAIEYYFATTEPASLALLLVTQSRLLIGRPLVEALDALMESSTGYAKITFGTETGFAISMSRMRDLSGYANIGSTDDWSEPAEGEVAAPVILSRDHAGLMLKAIEEFYRVREPSSPIPILLFKARNMLSKDFHALVRELIPPE